MRKPLAFVCLVVALLPLGAFASTDEPEAVYTLQIGDALPAVDFALADGSRVSREDLLGEFALIDFWATWCAPCIAAFPKLNDLERRFAERPIRFYSVTYESAEKIRPVLEQHPLDTAIGFDNDFSTFKSFRAWGIPVTYLINPHGIVVSVLHPEHLTAEVLEAALAGEIPEVEQSSGWSDPEGAEEYFRSLVE